MRDHDKPEVKSILLRNFAVIAIFIYLFASNIVGYSIHPFLVAVLIAVAFFLSPIAKTFRYLRSLPPTWRK